MEILSSVGKIDGDCPSLLQSLVEIFYVYCNVGKDWHIFRECLCLLQRLVTYMSIAKRFSLNIAKLLDFVCSQDCWVV